MKLLKLFALLASLVYLIGCVSPPPAYDYSAFKASNPRSIMVLPPINKTAEVIAPYSVLANVTVPLSEAGYYVFPVSLVNETFKSNGLTVAEDIHAVPTNKLHEIFGADTALYMEVVQYGTSYVVISSDTVVMLNARLVDLKTGQMLWHGSARASSSEQKGTNNHGLVGLLVEAALTQIIETVTDAGYDISGVATGRLLSPNSHNGILYGPRSPEYGKQAQEQSPN